MEKKYDIFISYRRDGGYDTAKHLNDLLVRDGYKVSFDIDTLRSGNFDTQLLSRIDQCKDFILIVDQHAFDRTLDSNFNPKNDWLRCELAYALKKRKNIIPIFLSGVNGFPDNLPADIAGVIMKHGPEYNKFYFNDFYKALKQRFLHSKKTPVKFIPVVFAFILIIITLGISYYSLSHSFNEDTDYLNRKQVDSSPKASLTVQKKDIDRNIYGVPPAPKYVEARISVAKPDYFDDFGSACEMAEKTYYGFVISSEELDENLIEVIMQEEDTRVKSKFYINKIE